MAKKSTVGLCVRSDFLSPLPLLALVHNFTWMLSHAGLEIWMLSLVTQLPSQVGREAQYCILIRADPKSDHKSLFGVQLCGASVEK